LYEKSGNMVLMLLGLMAGWLAGRQAGRQKNSAKFRKFLKIIYWMKYSTFAMFNKGTALL